MDEILSPRKVEGGTKEEKKVAEKVRGPEME